MPGVVAGAGQFDFDDVGSLVSQHQRAEGACQCPRKVKDPYAFQGLHRGLASNVQLVLTQASTRPRRPSFRA